MYWENEVPVRTHTSQEVWSRRAFTPSAANTWRCQQPATMILLGGEGLVPGSNRMPERIGLLAVSVLYGIVSMPAHAQEPRERATLERGEHVARLVCSACHIVARDQEFPPMLRPPAPSFETIANRPAITSQAVRHFVLQTHWDLKTLPMHMPDPMLPTPDANAVAAYVLSLRKP
jgi:mono/diheme cytochrome c family protein